MIKNRDLPPQFSWARGQGRGAIHTDSKRRRRKQKRGLNRVLWAETTFV